MEAEMSDEMFDFEEKPTTCPHCGRRLVDNVCPWCEKPTPVKHLHRAEGPSTSVAAAHSIKPTDLEIMVYDAIVSCGRHGATADELLEMFPGYSYSSITARPAALKRKDLIVDSGIKRRGRSGRNQSVLVAATHLTSESNVRSSDSPVPDDDGAYSSSSGRLHQRDYYTDQQRLSGERS